MTMMMIMCVCVRARVFAHKYTMKKKESFLYFCRRKIRNEARNERRQESTQSHTVVPTSVPDWWKSHFLSLVHDQAIAAGNYHVDLIGTESVTCT